jgi:hypothetical protein
MMKLLDIVVALTHDLRDLNLHKSSRHHPAGFVGSNLLRMVFE